MRRNQNITVKCGHCQSETSVVVAIYSTTTEELARRTPSVYAEIEGLAATSPNRVVTTILVAEALRGESTAVTRQWARRWLRAAAADPRSALIEIEGGGLKYFNNVHMEVWGLASDHGGA